MAVPTLAAIVLFAALEAAGVDLRWWGWLPTLFLTAAVVGFAVNGARDLVSSDAIPTLAADVLIGVFVLASTLTIFGLQQTDRAQTRASAADGLCTGVGQLGSSA